MFVCFFQPTRIGFHRTVIKNKKEKHAYTENAEERGRASELALPPWSVIGK